MQNIQKASEQLGEQCPAQQQSLNQWHWILASLKLTFPLEKDTGRSMTCPTHLCIDLTTKVVIETKGSKVDNALAATE